MRNMRSSLWYDNHEYVLDDPIQEIDDHSIDEEKANHVKHVDESNKVSRIMKVVMSSDL